MISFITSDLVITLSPTVANILSFIKALDSKLKKNANNTSIKIDDTFYQLGLRPKRTYLPFEIELNDFKKVMHPGTEIAKSFSSEVYLNKDDISKRFLIEMNAPLRYDEYTFYQASYAEFQGRELSILAVVKNYGRLFPYISSIIMCIGILIQLIIDQLYHPYPDLLTLS